MNSSWLAGSPFLIGNSNYVGNSQVAENEAGNNKEKNEKTSFPFQIGEMIIVP